MKNTKNIFNVQAPKASTRNRKKQNKTRSIAQEGSVANNGQKQAHNSLSQRVVKKEPREQATKRGKIVENTELVSQLTLGSVFAVTDRFRLNPASAKTFPWLSKQAPSYEEYKFHMLRFRFVTRVPTNTSGSLYLAPDYDAADSAPTTEQQISANVDTVEDVVWNSSVCHLKPERLNRAYKSHFNMTDTRFATTNQDQKTIDVGFLSIAGQMDGFTNAGKLFVDYKVEFFEPQYPTDFDNQGGVGLNKTSGLNVNSSNVFQSNAVGTLLQENQPIVSLLPNSSFPGPNLFQFNRDWSGYITKNITGTGLTGVGTILKNLLPIADTTIPTVTNSAGTNSTYQAFDNFKAGDIIGSNTIAGTTLTSMIMNLGGSSVD